MNKLWLNTKGFRWPCAIISRQNNFKKCLLYQQYFTIALAQSAKFQCTKIILLLILGTKSIRPLCQTILTLFMFVIEFQIHNKTATIQ